MANIDTLKAALVSAAASITNDIDRYDCLTLIDDWFACRSAVAAVQGNSIQSYSIAGRSVTRQNVDQFAKSERQLYARIHEYLYLRGCALVSLENASETSLTNTTNA